MLLQCWPPSSVPLIPLSVLRAGAYFGSVQVSACYNTRRVECQTGFIWFVVTTTCDVRFFGANSSSLPGRSQATVDMRVCRDLACPLDMGPFLPETLVHSQFPDETFSATLNERNDE